MLLHLGQLNNDSIAIRLLSWLILSTVSLGAAQLL